MNEPAFPFAWESPLTGKTTINNGMTLRDYFAAKAMQSLIASAPSGTSFGVNCVNTNNTFSIASYAIADAMLKARKA